MLLSHVSVHVSFCWCRGDAATYGASKADMTHANIAPDLVPRSGRSEAFPLLMSL